MPGEPDEDFLEGFGQAARIFGFAAGSFLVIRSGRTFLVRRGAGPIIRWVFTKSPEARQLVRMSIGDLPIIHEEVETVGVLTETGITLGFWSTYFFSPTFRDFFHVVTNRVLSLDAWETFLREWEFREAVEKGQVDEEGHSLTGAFAGSFATSLTSPTGRIASAVMNAWRADP